MPLFLLFFSLFYFISYILLIVMSAHNNYEQIMNKKLSNTENLHYKNANAKRRKNNYGKINCKYIIPEIMGNGKCSKRNG